jgi:hypothetical protein
MNDGEYPAKCGSSRNSRRGWRVHTTVVIILDGGGVTSYHNDDSYNTVGVLVMKGSAMVRKMIFLCRSRYSMSKGNLRSKLYYSIRLLG